MKPDFALDFRDNQITLRHRAEGAWPAIGQVLMDDPDLDAALGYLRATALGLSPRGIATKLILPNEAILYTALSGLPYDPARRAEAIAAGLVGRTPYDVADLVYNWTDSGETAHLAVIARETLAEAEEFATQHRFNPISFAALPDQGDYDGEVWFGATQLSQSLLAKGEVVERDDVSVLAFAPDDTPPAAVAASDFEMGAVAGDSVDLEPMGEPPQNGALQNDFGSAEPITSDSGYGDDMPAAGAGTEAVIPPAEPDASDIARVVVAPAETAAVDATPAEVDAVEPAPFDTAVTASPVGNYPLFEQADVPTDEAPQPEVTVEPAAIDPSPNVPEVLQEAPYAEMPVQDAPLAPVPDLPIEIAPPTDPSDTPSFETVLQDITKAEEAVEEAPMAIDVPLIDEPQADAMAPNPPRLPGAKKASKTETLLSAFAARRAAAKAKAPALVNNSADTAPSNAAFSPAAQQDTGATGPYPADALAVDPAGADSTAAPLDLSSLGMAPSAPKVGAALGQLGQTPPLAHVPIAHATAARPPAVKHVPAKNLPQKTQDLKAMPHVKPRSSGRMGWILTALLLLALMAAAALSTYMIEAASNLYNGNNTSVAAQDAGQSPAPTAVPVAPIATATDTAPSSATQQPDAATNAAKAAAAAAPASPAVQPPIPTLPAQIANNLVTKNLVAPKIAALPIVPALPALPPLVTVAETTAQFLVQQERPPVVPAPRPPSLAQAADSPAQTAGAEATVQTTAYADPALATARPAPRSAAVLAAAAAAGAAQPAAANPALVDARPAPRPSGIEDEGRAARLASAPASLVASAQINATEAALLGALPAITPAPDPNRSALALTISPVPQPRPNGLKAAFEDQEAAAVAAAVAAASAETALPAASTASLPPSEDVAALEAEIEEEVTKSSGGATRTIVDKQATVKNAMNLSDVSLVGIFGSNANRYALIRQPSGRFKKLKVGDRFDGGRVAAITENEVRYDKGGELIALRMPKT